MTLLRSGLWTGGILCCALCLPSAWAITGCSNAYLQGAYNIQIDNASVINTLNALNTASAPDPIPGAAPAGSVTAPGQVEPIFPGSLTNSAPYLGRYYFDGNGNVVGMENARDTSGALHATSAVVGTYSVDDGCNATISLNGGRRYTAVLASQGQSAVFVETDKAGRGATGTLQRSASSCGNPSSPQNYAFRYSGASQTGIGAGASFQPYSSVGTMTLDGAGNFTMSSTVLANGSVQRTKSTGTYNVATDCSIQLSFAASVAPDGGATTGAFEGPSVFNGLMAGSSGGGLLSVQPAGGGSLSGLVIVQ